MGIHQMIAPAVGGQLAPITAPSLSGSEADALEAALADMTAAFSSDVADCRPGRGRDTYEHRSRVLRQMTENLAAMRARDGVAAS